MLRNYLARLIPKIVKPAFDETLTWSSIVGSILLATMLSHYRFEGHISDTPLAAALYTLVVIIISLPLFILLRIFIAPYQIFKEDASKLIELASSNKRISDTVAHSIIFTPLTQWRSDENNKYADVEVMMENTGVKPIKYASWKYEFQSDDVGIPKQLKQGFIANGVIPRGTSKSFKVVIQMPITSNGFFISTSCEYGLASGGYTKRLVKCMKINFGDDMLTFTDLLNQETDLIP